MFLNEKSHSCQLSINPKLLLLFPKPNKVWVPPFRLCSRGQFPVHPSIRLSVCPSVHMSVRPSLVTKLFFEVFRSCPPVRDLYYRVYGLVWMYYYVSVKLLFIPISRLFLKPFELLKVKHFFSKPYFCSSYDAHCSSHFETFVYLFPLYLIINLPTLFHQCSFSLLRSLLILLETL